jgi:hypothetical protein
MLGLNAERLMSLILFGIVGALGVAYPPRPVDPDDPWPPGCTFCNLVAGAAAAVILLAFIGSAISGAGLLGQGLAAYFAGRFGGPLIGAAYRAYGQS